MIRRYIMATVLPFKAIRPREDLADQIAALPYDVYNRKEAKEVVSKNSLSFLKIDRAETSFSDDVSTYDDRVYQAAHDMLWEMVNKGEFVSDTEDSYYIYELTMDKRAQTGIVACASVDDYENAVIKKHENTRAEKEKDRIRHVDACKAQTGPIFLAYRSNEAIKNVINAKKASAPLYDFTSEDGITHKAWIINESHSIEIIKNAFASINEIYIADGHHRCASAVRVSQMRRAENPNYTGDEDFNYFLSVLFPDEELYIMDYNRVVKDLNGLSEEEFLEQISKDFTVTKSDNQVKPENKGEFGLYLRNSGWYKLAIHEDKKNNDPVNGLDVSLLQKYMLTPVLGIGDPKVDPRIDFVGGIRGLNELEKRSKDDCVMAVSMYPTSIHELFDVADAGLLMPPKSTWFEPKLRSGLFIHAI